MKKKDYSEQFVLWGVKILRLNLSEKTLHLLVQIFKFGIVGVVATLIDFIFLYLFKELGHFPILLSNTLSFTISVLYNYWASLTFVFDVDTKKSKTKNFIIFIICSILGLLLNNMIVWITTEKIHIYYMISKVIATIFVMIFNFITRKKFLES